MVERFNRTLLNLLSIAVKEDEHNWDAQLLMSLLAYRISVHEAANTSPFYLTFGRDPQLPEDIFIQLARSSSPTKKN